MSSLTLGASTIRESNGLYFLQDLHKASGGENRHRPSLFLENKQTRSLIAEIVKAGIPALDAKHGGSAPGTFACKELVIAYAAWISPAFHLKVIRCFLNATSNQPQPQPQLGLVKATPQLPARNVRHCRVVRVQYVMEVTGSDKFGPTRHWETFPESFCRENGIFPGDSFYLEYHPDDRYRERNPIAVHKAGW